MLRKEDVIRLRHMLEAAHEAVCFVAGRSRVDLDKDRILVFALVQAIEIIGEAARQVSTECQRACPVIPWADIIAMRNRLIHAYFDIDLDRVWDTVKDDLPGLIHELEQLVKEEDSA